MSRFRDDRKQPVTEQPPVKTQAEIEAKKNELKKTIVEKEVEVKNATAPKVIERHQAKNGAKKVWVEDNIDPKVEKRKRNKHGTAINFPLFVEEFLAIEEVFNAALDAGQTDSFADYVREVVKAHAKSKLGSKRYEEILSKKMNQVIVKKSDKVISE